MLVAECSKPLVADHREVSDSKHRIEGKLLIIKEYSIVSMNCHFAFL